MPALHAHPLVLALLLDELGGGDAASREISAWLLRDPALAAHLLDKHPEALTQAKPDALLERLDNDDLKRWLLPAAIRVLGRFPASASLRDWQASISCALLCQAMARQLGYPPANEAYLAGLLHNLDRYADAGAPGSRRAAILPAAGTQLSCALQAQDEDDGRLAEALPLGRLLRVARAVVNGEGDGFRLAAKLLPELTPDDLDDLRRQVETATTELLRQLVGQDGQNDILAQRERLNTALDDYFRIEQAHAALAATTTEAELLAAVLSLLENQLRLRQPLYLVHDRATDTLAPFPGSRHAGLRIRLPGSNSAAAWAMSSRVPVIFATQDAESVSLLDVQLARLADAGAVIAIPVGERNPIGVLLGCVDLPQAQNLERASAYLGRLGRLFGREMMRLRAAPAATESAAEQLRAKARRAAHEINNPLGIARNYLAILGAQLAEQGRPADELAIIREELDRIPRLLQALTNDEPGLAMRREGCDLTALVRDLTKVAESAVPAGRNVRIATRIEPGLPVIYSDAGKLRQMLLNLILNAIEACPEEGLVGVDAYTSIDLRGARQVFIAVRDNGGGIAPDRLARLYEPSGSDKGGQHAGLGLAIVKTLATELGMTVACRSDNQGTTFQVATTAV
ncbi:MAG: HDOD domain-containing protein [Thiobacillus sp.]|nr:HDOD domain-containing protein [Thiobacillus sp.]